jgi:hypothetical protein
LPWCSAFAEAFALGIELLGGLQGRFTLTLRFCSQLASGVDGVVGGVAERGQLVFGQGAHRRPILSSNRRLN